MTTLNLQVAAGADDAWELGTGGCDTDDSFLALSNESRWGGLRFQDVAAPQGSSVSTAACQIYLPTTNADSPHLDVYGDGADNAAAFTTASYDISGRSLTTAKATVNADNVGAGWYALPDLAGPVAEVFARASWAAGNALAVILDCLSGVDLNVRTWDGDNSLAAKLDIDYTAPAAGGQPMALRGQAVPGVRGAWSGKCIA